MSQFISVPLAYLTPLEIYFYFRLVSQGKDIFGDGNIEATVKDFEKQHTCNHFCEWPGFKLEKFVGGSVTLDVDVL